MYLSSEASGIGSLSFTIADGDAGIEQTISMIRTLVHQGVRDVTVNRTALEILQGVPPHEPELEAQAIYNWVRKNIRFTNDIYGAETLRPAAEILRVRAGDCDDINGILLPTLLESVGIQSRLVTIAADDARPDNFSHIYCEANLDGAWTPLDAAARSASFGRAPAVYWRKKIWPVTNEDGHIAGLGMYLGQDDDGGGSWTDTLSQLVPVITAGTTGAANVIKAFTAPYSLTTTATTTAPRTTSSGLQTVAAVQGSSSGVVILMGGAALLIFALMALKR